MKYRTTELLSAVDPGASGTKVIDINLVDPISRIDILYKVNLVSEAMIAQIGANITRIELVDGSDVLFSLTGLEAQALGIYDRRVDTMNSGGLIAGSSSYAVFPIDFGRFLHDPELAFDPTKFRNPQLKITYNEVLVDASVSVHTIQIFAEVFDEKEISPQGFLMSKEHYSYTPTANDAYEYIDLPTDHLIRQMLIRGFVEKKESTSVVDFARLSEEHDKRVVFDMDLGMYAVRMKGVWKPVTESILEYVNAGGDYDKFVTPTDYQTIWVGMSQDSGYPNVDGYIRGGFVERKGTATSMNMGLVYGYIPNHCMQIPFGDPKDLDDWYDVTTKGSVELRLQAAAGFSGGLISVVLQQLRRY